MCALSRERLARWGLDTQPLAQRHPRLVVVNLTAYGTTGPWADRAGSGTLAEAMSGLAGLTGPADAPPTLSPVGLGDYMGVQQGIIAALLGLYARDARGGSDRGELLDVAMYEPLLGLLAPRIAAATRDGVEPGRHGNRFPTVAPRNTYRTADGAWVALTAGTDELVHRMFRLFDRPQLCDDPRFRDNLARVAHVDALDAIISEWIGARSCDEVVEQFNAAGVSLAAVDGLLQVAANPHFRARGSLVDIAGDDAGSITTAAPSPVRAHHPGRVEHLGRDLGADNHAVYCDWLGLDEQRAGGAGRGRSRSDDYIPVKQWSGASDLGAQASGSKRSPSVLPEAGLSPMSGAQTNESQTPRPRLQLVAHRQVDRLRLEIGVEPFGAELAADSGST